MLKRFLKNHELSLWLTGVWLGMIAAGAWMPESKFAQWFADHAGEVFGALVVVFAQRVLHLRERK